MLQSFDDEGVYQEIVPLPGKKVPACALETGMLVKWTALRTALVVKNEPILNDEGYPACRVTMMVASCKGDPYDPVREYIWSPDYVFRVLDISEVVDD
jgi:hypothetical protein